MKKTYFILIALLLAFAMLFSACDEGGEETTAIPETTEAPGATAEVETTSAPQTTMAPETTTAPETTKAPETTTAPETMSVPETTASPEATSIPEATAAPEVTTEPPHTHAWSAWSVKKAATCTEAGSEERNCSCGEKETRSIVATGHGFGEWKTEKAASCTVDGMRTRSCACGELESKAISAIGHSYKDGKCSSCGASDPSVQNADKIYSDAVELINNGKYEEAYARLLSIKDKKDVSEYLDKFVWVCGKEAFSNSSGAYKSVIEYTVNDNGYVTEAHETDSRGLEYITQYLYESDRGGLLIETARWQVGTEDNFIVGYIYDNYGLLVEKVLWSSIEDAEYNILYEYDGEGRLSKEINNNFNMPYTVEYTYDNSGKLAQSAMIDAFGTTVTKYEYDKNGLLVKESTNYYDGDGVITYEYDSNGNLIKMTEPDGSNTVYSDYKLYYREESKNSGTLKLITDYSAEWVSWSNGEVIAVEHEGKYYVIDISGKILAGPFDGMVCPDLNGYAVGFVRTKEVVGTALDEYDNTPYDVVKTTKVSYVIDPTGKIVFEKTGSVTDYFYESIYDGEYIEHYTEGMLVTITYDDYYLGMSRNYYTVHIYDSKGNKLADYSDLIEHGAYINGKMVMITAEGEIFAVDKSGRKIASSGFLTNKHPLIDSWYYGMIFASIGDGHHMSYFPGGYTIIEVETYSSDDDYFHLILSEDMNTSYLINKAYLYDNRNYGTLVFSKIVENGKVSDGYYLIDVAKCGVDEKGLVIPTRSAAVYDKEFSSGTFYNVFGQTEKYALVSTSDGKWGFLSMDGKALKMYDDACCFSAGVAAVKDGGEFYVIDESFNRISNAISGYDSVTACGNGWFTLRKGDTGVVAVYSEAE